MQKPIKQINENLKKCSKCGIIKPVVEFHQDKARKDGFNYHCKSCRYSECLISRAKNRDHWLEYHKIWRKTNKDYHQKYGKKWAVEHREQRCESQHRWITKNKGYTQKYRNDPKRKLSNSISSNIRNSLKFSGVSKGGRHWEDLVGFTINQLKNYLEKRFKPGMTWENYGTYWQIDHVIPISAFNYERVEDMDFKRCWSLKNLQPLETKENMIKHNKIDKPFQPALTL